MPEITLYHMPASCSRVTMIALEEAELDFGDVLIDLMSGEQKSAEYKAINPKGKVPALRIGDRILTENPAILHLLNEAYPRAGLLPASANAFERQEGLADLVWCASTLHPLVRQIRNPSRLTDGDTAALKDKGAALFADAMAAVDALLAERPWWRQTGWSIVDAYLHWTYTTAEGGGFVLEPFGAILRHREAMEQRSSFVRAIGREEAALNRAGSKASAGQQSAGN